MLIELIQFTKTHKISTTKIQMENININADLKYYYKLIKHYENTKQDD